MSGLTFESMNNWRVEASKLFNEETFIPIHTINPVDFYNFEMSPDSYTENEVKKFDLQMVKTSNLILVNLDFPDSIGTAMELCMAHDVWDIPVIGFGKDKSHPWMELCVSKRCVTLENAVRYICDFYLPNI
ncbi:MAG TPA: hypothetical protein VIK72_17010 [Clostridiaceae bacterium]